MEGAPGLSRWLPSAQASPCWDRGWDWGWDWQEQSLTVPLGGVGGGNTVTLRSSPTVQEGSRQGFRARQFPVNSKKERPALPGFKPPHACFSTLPRGRSSSQRPQVTTAVLGRGQGHHLRGREGFFREPDGEQDDSCGLPTRAALDSGSPSPHEDQSRARADLLLLHFHGEIPAQTLAVPHGRLGGRRALVSSRLCG